jgi:hypothetical protein
VGRTLPGRWGPVGRSLLDSSGPVGRTLLDRSNPMGNRMEDNRLHLWEALPTSLMPELRSIRLMLVRPYPIR